MDTRFLQSFVSVVEHGSIAEAARRLDLTSSTVSERLKSLEADLGSRLVARSGRTVRATEAGLQVLEQARRILRDVRDLRSAASNNALPKGPLRLGATPSALTGILPSILGAWARHHPQIEIFIEPATTSLLYDHLLSGEIDVALLVRPLFQMPKAIKWHNLRNEPLILLTPAHIAVEDPLSTVASEAYICYDRSVVGGKLADDYLRSLGIRPKIRFELDGIEAIAKLVSEGLGVSVLPDWLVCGATDLTTKRWRLPEPNPCRAIGFAWHQHAPNARLAEAFISVAHFPQAPQPGEIVPVENTAVAC